MLRPRPRLTAPSAALLVLPLGLVACGQVVFDRDDDATEASAAGPAVAASTSSGAAPAPSTGAGGAGGAPGVGGGAAEGGAPAEPPPPVASCGAIDWLGEPMQQDLDSTKEAGDMHLQEVRRADDPLSEEGAVTFLGTYVETDPDFVEQGIRRLEAWYPWAEAIAGHHARDAHFRKAGHPEWLVTGTPQHVALGAGRGGYAAFVQPRGRHLREFLPDGGFPLPEGIDGVLDLAWSDRGVYALAHGAAEAPRVALVAPSHEPVAIRTELAACADRPVALDLVPLGDGFLVASTTGAGCDVAPEAPTRVVLTMIDDAGGIVSREERDAGGVVSDVVLLRHGEGAWLVTRREGVAAITVERVDAAGVASPVGEVPLAPDRRFGLATRLHELVVVDSSTEADGPALRIRTFAGDLTPIAESPPLPFDVEPSGAPAVYVRGDGGAFLVATFVTNAEGVPAIAGVRALCAEGGAR